MDSGQAKNHTIAIIGAGIFGLSHAWAAAKRGCRVTVFERSRECQGASIRNFGMIWPIGQPFGHRFDLAMLSRKLWQEAAVEAGIWLNPCGSLFLAHHDDELAVLEQFAKLADERGHPKQILSAEQVLRKSPVVNLHGLRGGLYSDTELGVNPPQAVRALAEWLRSLPRIKIHYQTPIVRVEPGTERPVRVQTAAGHEQEFDEVFVCSGADIDTLFPEVMPTAGFRLCKLQMMRTAVQPSGIKIGPHLASGLTLRHYPAFENCPAIHDVRARIAKHSPELDAFGIHVMASQTDCGEVILGDSHEYGTDIEPFDKPQIDELILRELKKIIELPSWELIQRWHGIYAKYSTDCYWSAEPIYGVRLFTGLGGNGMTLAMGLAETFWAERTSSSVV